MDAHYDRVSQNSYELCIMHLHYALGVHIVCYVLRIMYYVLCITHCHWESTSSVMYYVLRIMRIMHYALGVHIVCYVCVLRITYYVLRTGGGRGPSHVLVEFVTEVYDVGV